ncbi:uncharacterized protein L969DRAFT_14189 [Mixia osmundae IAM 14324]|uniref:Phosphatidylinositol-specific phospholipase C X domain-containing protein n=1 Tax=Mixia osmundae (strain CBS 9802 / IAM 14324 / JCM 22182 / KY 12970) TaxID=764103 RepID=G7E3X9_MIXOS|nr:uncharacterized protein L969DRAFT_14189 [Mixia osmundae IAM 14324]KEI41985.1 hypothetical protein L969DRAFT_14189 [Mixia osmundae IAM 14324]GAA97539.1 hypothetical protein E5Q_04217 [Mixia osmundae IAM 14324]
MLRQSTLLSVLLASLARAQSVCNGHAELCSRQYSNVTYIGAHDSYAVNGTAGESAVAANQNYNVTVQLDDGIRLLQGQGHALNGSLHLCHTSCTLFDGGTAQAYLSEVKSWLDANPNEVITILMTNPETLSPAVWGQAYAAAGLDTVSYTPPTFPLPKSQWPTLQELISNNTRVVNFLDFNADPATVPYIIDEFTNIWETPYDVTDSTFPCTIDRINGTASDQMYLVNHFLDANITIGTSTLGTLPDTAALPTTNSEASIEANAESCASEHGSYPTFVLVDYYSIPSNGSVFAAAAALNGVTYTSMATGSTSSGTGSSTSNTTTASSTPIMQSGKATFTSVSSLAFAIGLAGLMHAL